MKAGDKIKAAKMRKMAQKELEIESMSNEEIKNELKEKKLEVFGTNEERKNRLKKYHGFDDSSTPTGSADPKKKPASNKSNVVDKIKEMEEKRNERRK